MRATTREVIFFLSIMLLAWSEKADLNSKVKRQKHAMIYFSEGGKASLAHQMPTKSGQGGEIIEDNSYFSASNSRR